MTIDHWNRILNGIWWPMAVVAICFIFKKQLQAVITTLAARLASPARRSSADQPNRDWMQIAVIGGVLLAVIVAMAASLYFIEMADFSDSESASKVVASVVALVGVVFTGTVTAIGFMLRSSQERATEARLRTESAKLDQQQKDTEARLRIEVVLKAASLFQSAEAGTPSARAGALLSLVELEMLEFALRILAQLWPARKIEAATAVWVIDRGLQSADIRVRNLAAVTLEENATRLFTEGNIQWPSTVEVAWDKNWDHTTKLHLLKALFKAIIAFPREEWHSDVLNAIYEWMFRILHSGDAQSFRSAAAKALLNLLKPYAAGYAPKIAIDHEEDIDFEKVREELALDRSLLDGPSIKELDDLCTRIEEWAEVSLPSSTP